jgi:mono/diheme cytochrome c family protein
MSVAILRCQQGLAALVLMVLLVGCNSRTADYSYSLRKEVSELPALHQQEIQTHLVRYFGTPVDPRLMLPTDKEDDKGQTVLQPKLERLYLKRGVQVYLRECVACHGASGDGMGEAAAYLNPPPRDYRKGIFKFASTPQGTRPRREDLRRVIRRGAKGTSMPSFRWISQEDLEAVIDYVVLLSQRGQVETRMMQESEQELDEKDSYDPKSVAKMVTTVHHEWDVAADNIVQPLTPMPKMTPETVKHGAELFGEMNCIQCHGKDGSGRRDFDAGKDAWGRTAYAADLTSGLLHGGRRPIDIYRRIYSGITPMPSSATPNSAKNETAEQRSENIWHLVHFITSVVEGSPFPADIVQGAFLKAQAENQQPMPDTPAPTPDTPAPDQPKPTDDPKPTTDSPKESADPKTADEPKSKTETTTPDS